MQLLLKCALASKKKKKNEETEKFLHKPSPIHSTSLEMSEVSSDAAILLIRVPQQTDAAIVMSAL